MNDEIDSELKELIRSGREHADGLAHIFLQQIEDPTPVDDLKIRVFLATKRMFVQLEPDDWQIIAELMTLADPQTLGLVAAIPEEFREVMKAQRVPLWEAAREKFDRAGILAKLSSVQLRFVEQFVLATRE